MAQTDVVRQFVAAGQSVSVGATSAQASSAFPENTRAVRVVCTVDCFVEFGSNPTAAANTSTFLPAGTVEYFAVYGAQKVALIRLSGDGTAYVRPTN